VLGVGADGGFVNPGQMQSFPEQQQPARPTGQRLPGPCQ